MAVRERVIFGNKPRSGSQNQKTMNQARFESPRSGKHRPHKGQKLRVIVRISPVVRSKTQRL